MVDPDRPDLDPAGCVAIRLADGREWLFRKPTIGLTPVVSEDGTLVVRPDARRMGEEYADLLQSFYFQKANDLAWLGFVFGMARLLLHPGYRLSDDAICGLFYYQPGEAASEAMLDGLRMLVVGRTPEEKKASPAT